LGETFCPDFPVPEGHEPGEFMASEALKGTGRAVAGNIGNGKGTDEENRRVYYGAPGF